LSNKSWQAKQLLNYFRQAKTSYQIHAPFLFDFVTNILEDDRNYYIFEHVEAIRRQLLKNKDTIQIKDFGAGSLVSAEKQRKVNEIAKHSLSSPYFCQLMFKLIHHYQCKNLLELGTSLGISAIYQASANTNNQLITLEGDPTIASIAQYNFDYLKMNNVELMVGQFEQTLPIALNKLKRLDYVYIDGNHRKEPTIQYFEKCLRYAHSKSIFVLDDIHWSKGMQDAWNTVKAHPKVRLSIDLYYCGILFFDEDIVEKQDVCLIQQRFKPWVMGFFK